MCCGAKAEAQARSLNDATSNPHMLKFEFCYFAGTELLVNADVNHARSSTAKQRVLLTTSGQQRIYESASRGFRLCFAQPASDISATVPRAKQCGRLGSRDSIASHHFELVLRNSKWHKDFIQVRLANWKRT
uniref:Uncharacterized protein n=1 Tax=Trichuris muris TaxID=70415 RepID=A0A5S6QGN4_TRIMR